VIAIQYTITAIAIGLVARSTLSVLDAAASSDFRTGFSLIAPQNYYQFITLHGMIMVIYLLTRGCFSAVSANYIIPLNVRCARHVFHT